MNSTLIANSTKNRITDFAVHYRFNYNELSVTNSSHNKGEGISVWYSSGNILTENLAIRNFITGFLVIDVPESNDLMLNKGCHSHFLDAVNLSTFAGNSWIDSEPRTFNDF